MRVIVPNISAEEGAQLTDEQLLQKAVADKYATLFADLNTEYRDLFASQTPPLTVDNLVTYYRGLQIISNDPNAPKLKPQYLRLPLDEPAFNINMDDRTITVPPVFNNYGFGVKGDALAEIVFFISDRFYDGVDLAAMTPGITTNTDPTAYDCVVQWTNTASRVSGNSKVVLADATEDQITFGWVITQEMTSVSGPIEFAVRWMKLEEGKKVYSVSTQRATCQVKSTLDLDYDNTAVEDISDLILTRPFYSGVLNSMSGSAPQISKNLEAAIRDLVRLTAPEPVDEGDEGYEEYRAALARYNELVEQYPAATYPDGVLDLGVDASSPDGMNIVYQWFNGLNQINGQTTKNYVATAPGAYYVKIGNDGTSAGRGVRYTTSPTVTVPAPDQIKFAALDTLSDYFGSKTFSTADRVLAVNVKNAANEDPNGTLTYTWKRSQLMDGTTVLTTKNYVAVENTNVEHPEQFIAPVGDEAYYICEVVNKKNNATSNTITKESTPVLVRAMPDTPAAVVITFDEENQKLKASVQWGENSPSRLHPDEIYFEWGRQSGGIYSKVMGGSGYDATQFDVSQLGLENGRTWEDDFYCYVSHIVYKDEANQTQGGRKLSNHIHLAMTINEATNKTKMVATE